MNRANVGADAAALAEVFVRIIGSLSCAEDTTFGTA